mmetsp:Transcript_87760/g.174218  ORF Transcript_87760/g.174218 Transcript_87760/m.174218 type:complete len:425 (+) Transcript_87760:140-1414(+)
MDTKCPSPLETVKACSVVVDIGAAGSRFGFSGSPLPAVQLFHAPAEAVAQESTENLQRPFNYSEGSGLKVEPDAFEACLRSGFNHLLPETADSSSGAQGQSLLLIEPTQVSKVMRRRLCEVAFEGMQVQRIFVAKRAALSVYAHGLTSGLILDAGASHTCASAVSNGWVVPESVMDCRLGGDLLDAALLEQLVRSGMQLQVPIRCLKEAGCSCRISGEGDHVKVADGVDKTRGPGSVLLPDGERVELGTHSKTLLEVPELLFTSPIRTRRPFARRLAAGPPTTTDYSGLHFMLAESVAAAEEASRALPKQLGRSVVLCGGCSGMAGFTERMRAELRSLNRKWQARVDGGLAVMGTASTYSQLNGTLDELITSSGTVDIPSTRTLTHSCWTGGAILASLGSLEEFWVTRADYKESGMVAVRRKCP